MSDKRSLRRIVIAAALSAAAHVAVMATGREDRPHDQDHLPPLAVRIESVAAPEPAARPRPRRAPGIRPREARPAARHTAPVPAAAPVAQTEADAAEVPTSEAPLAEELPVERAPPDAPSEPAIVASAPASTYTPEPAALPAFPRRGRISYTLLYGRDGFPVGRTEQSWQIEGGRYQLASHSETTGLVDLIRSKHLTYLSRGELTAEGLRPETFLMSRNRGRGVEEARARFDWDGGSLTLGRASAQREEALPRGSQDLVSFMYQLALDPPPPGRTRVSVTNGSRLETYELEVHPEEKIETPLGVLRALPIRQVRSPGEESIELWLATEYRHVPVRIRFYGRDGEPTGEQMVSEIRLTEEP